MSQGLSEGRRGPLRLHDAFEKAWGSGAGWQSLAAVNHSIVGRRFILTSFAFFLIGGVLAMLIRAQLAGPDTAFMEVATYNQIFTMHGTVMMFLFAIPLIEGFTLYMLPKILGARDLAFPRLSAFGYWCYLFGGTIIIGAMLAGIAPDGGWFMYTPLSSRTFSPGINADVWLIGVTFVEVSAVCAAVEFMTTVLKVRCSGMALNRMPILAWYLWVTAAMMLFGFPPLILGSILLEVERAFDWPFFDPTRGGDPLLWQHLFWLFGHPEVYIIFLPAAGIVSTVLPVFAGRPLVGYAWIVCSIVALGFISFGLWVHHMFATGIPHLSLAFFSAASTLVVIPTAVQVFAWLTTLLTGQPRLSLPMLYIYGFLFIFVLGGLTGVMVAVVPFDWQVHDTYFVVAHLHYVLIGGFVFPALAGAYYWLPHVTGRLHDRGLGRFAFWLIFGGFNLAFLPMHLTGLLGMPRRVATYGPEVGWSTLNLVSSIGGFVLTIGFALFVLDVIQQARFGPRASRNPWRAGTLEWAMPTPPPSYNIAALPRVEVLDPLHADPELPARLARGEGHLARPTLERRETLGVQMLDGRPDQVLLLPGPTWIPLLTAAAAALFFGSLLLKLYPLALVGAAGVVVCAWCWLWDSGARTDPEPLPIGLGEHALPHYATSSPPGLWGLAFALMANGTLFGALLFGYAFLWVVAPGWPPPELLATSLQWPGLALVAALSGLGASHAARRANASGRTVTRDACLILALGSAILLLAAFLLPWFAAAPDPTSHAYGAAVGVLVAYQALQSAIVLLIGLYALARGRRGYVSAMRAVELRAHELFWTYQGIVTVVTASALYGPLWAFAS